MTPDSPTIDICPQCGAQLAPKITMCPGCARLVYAERLEQLATTAREATEREDFSAAMGAWREALELLPKQSRQYEVIAGKISELGTKVPLISVPKRDPNAPKQGPIVRAMAALGALGMLIWKFKTLALGLTKGSTLITMLLSIGAFWTLWGWPFAVGFVLAIYVHEMGHLFAMQRYGFKPSAPMFIPGIAAYVRFQLPIANAHEDAVISLAGPLYGFFAAIVSLGIWLVTDNALFAAIASATAWLNLLNLLPFPPLDGSRALHAMSQSQKFLAAIVPAVGWAVTHDGTLAALAIFCFLRTLGDKPKRDGDWIATVYYCLLVVALAVLFIAIPGKGLPGPQPS